MIATASSLRKDIYRLLDQVAAGGEPLLIKRKGKLLKVSVEQPADKWSQLGARKCTNGDPEDLVHVDWSAEWNHDLP